jgi:periplasmic copper chaperone A
VRAGPYAWALLAGAIALPAAACPGLSASDARIPEAPPVATVLAGYAMLGNSSAQPLHIDAIDGVDFGSVEMHQMSMEGGMMQMRPLQGIDIPAHGSVSLDPSGKHLMLMNPKHPFKAGDSASLVFHCGKQATPLQFTVKAQP